MEEEKAKKILENYYLDLSERSLKLLEKQGEWASVIEERSLTFSQFLFTIGAALLAIFFSVHNLIFYHNIFNWGVGFSIFSFLFFIISFKEKIDTDSVKLTEGNEQNEINFKEAYDVLDRQLKNGINIDEFYKDIEKLSDKSEEQSLRVETKAEKMGANYSLELYLFCSLTSLWFLFFSTQKWNLLYLFLGIIIIFYVSNNQNKFFYRFILFYSKKMNKIFPTKNL